jgi:MerR family glutamine synthetase transcriptional repressor
VSVKNKKEDAESLQSSSNYTMAVTVKLTGIEPHRIRRYEEGGLLTPERTEGNQRLFSYNDIEIIKEAAKLEDEGINVEGIKAILAMRRGERK